VRRRAAVSGVTDIAAVNGATGLTAL